MTLHLDQIKGLPCETRSGQKIGHVIDFIIDPLSRKIVQVEIKGGAIFRRNHYLVHNEQVISITEKKVVIEDAAIASQADQIVSGRSKAPLAEEESSL